GACEGGRTRQDPGSDRVLSPGTCLCPHRA
ncbi:hypothetical protein HaLaN_32808, partial [Haematococcus lacustris]